MFLILLRRRPRDDTQKLSITTFRTFPLLPLAAGRLAIIHQQIIAFAVRRGEVVKTVRVGERQLLVLLAVEQRREPSHSRHPFTVGAIKEKTKCN